MRSINIVIQDRVPVHQSLKCSLVNIKKNQKSIFLRGFKITTSLHGTPNRQIFKAGLAVGRWSQFQVDNGFNGCTCSFIMISQHFEHCLYTEQIVL